MPVDYSPSDAYMELSFRPIVELIPYVRKFVTEFYTRMIDDRDAVSRVALATHELLENAVRYSVDGETKVRIEVLAGEPGKRVLVRTWNRTNTKHEGVVRAMFDAMTAAPDPFLHYQDLMRRTAKVTNASGLGLARIRAEAEMALNYSVTDGILCIEAETNVEART